MKGEVKRGKVESEQGQKGKEEGKIREKEGGRKGPESTFVRRVIAQAFCSQKSLQEIALNYAK